MSFQGEVDELVRDTTKSISQVEEGDMEGLLLHPGMFDCLLHDGIVFKATGDARKECFLDCIVNDFVLQKEGGESPGEN